MRNACAVPLCESFVKLLQLLDSTDEILAPVELPGKLQQSEKNAVGDADASRPRIRACKISISSLEIFRDKSETFTAGIESESRRQRALRLHSRHQHRALMTRDAKMGGGLVGEGKNLSHECALLEVTAAYGRNGAVVDVFEVVQYGEGLANVDVGTQDKDRHGSRGLPGAVISPLVVIVTGTIDKADVGMCFSAR